MIHRSRNEITDMEAMKNDIVETIAKEDPCTIAEKGKILQFKFSEPSIFALQCICRKKERDRGKTWTLMDRNMREKSVQRASFLT